MENSFEQKDSHLVTNKEDNYNKVIPVLEWVGVVILMAIPLVNIVMIIIWATSSTTNQNKKNYALATLIVWGVLIALFFLLGFSFIGLVSGIAN